MRPPHMMWVASATVLTVAGAVLDGHTGTAVLVAGVAVGAVWSGRWLRYRRDTIPAFLVRTPTVAFYATDRRSAEVLADMCRRDGGRVRVRRVRLPGCPQQPTRPGGGVS